MDKWIPPLLTTCGNILNICHLADHFPSICRSFSHFLPAAFENKALPSINMDVKTTMLGVGVKLMQFNAAKCWWSYYIILETLHQYFLHSNSLHVHSGVTLTLEMAQRADQESLANPDGLNICCFVQMYCTFKQNTFMQIYRYDK